MSQISPNNWADISPFDAELEKTLNSLLQPTTNTGGTDNASPGSASFASSWPAPFRRTLSSESGHTMFGLSPSITMGATNSPGGGFLDAKLSAGKSDGSWLSSFNPMRTTGMETLTGASAVAMSNDAPSSSSIRTPADAPSLDADMARPLGSQSAITASEASVSMDDFMEFDEVARDASTPLLSPASMASQPSPRDSNLTLSGYHSNVAADLAQHLSHLVTTSNMLEAGHSGPKSLAYSLSRSVMKAGSLGRPNVNSTQTTLSTDKTPMSIQQRRRLSHLGSQPHPSSPEMSKSTLTRQRRNTRSHCDAISANEGAVPSSAQNHEEWNDAVLTNSHDLVFVLSLKGTVLYMSPSALRILGFLPEEIVGRPLVDFCHPADVGPFSRELKEAITNIAPGGDGDSGDVAAASISAAGVKPQRRVDLIMRMACKSGGFSLIETTGRVSVDPPKHRKVVVCSGRPHPIPMLPWNDVREDLLRSELSAWLKVSHNGIFLGSTGPINQILGIEDVDLLGRHLRDLPMVHSSSDLLEALRCGRSISVQDHYDGSSKAPVKLTVYPWTSNGRSHSLAFVHVQQQPLSALNVSGGAASHAARPVASSPLSAALSPSSTASLGKRKMSLDGPMDTASAGAGGPHSGNAGEGACGSLSGSAVSNTGATMPVMTANDAAATVFSELTGFHSGSWLIEMQRLHNANKRLRHELSALRKRSPHSRPLEIC
ncbi:hypothetical protein BCV70DRAFT_225643 [Testicularia cyperi]|uniref:PAS domain-containing protein n=1 Tax=Testicularia cyperi TaxID=1882483 RepID=A0A317XSH7_9BASI|nr:hypothetical protein BCV70DRAFT_225643 [Testicularia cyperi]